MTNGMVSPKKKGNTNDSKKVAKKDESEKATIATPISTIEGNSAAIFRLEQVFNSKIEGLNSKIEVLTNLLNSKDKEIAGLNQLVGSLNAEVSNLKKGFNFMSNETSDLKKVVEKTEKENIENITQLKEKTTDLEDRGRRNNLVFFGIKEASDRNTENCEELVTNLIKQQGIADFAGDYVFERVHRLGPKRNNSEGKPRPIICRFSSYKDREHVLRNSFKLKGTHYGIAEDFSKATLSVRNELVAKGNLAKEQSSLVKGFRVAYRRLILKYEDPKSKAVFFRGYSLSDTRINATWYLPNERKVFNNY